MLEKILTIDEHLTSFISNIFPHNSFFDSIFSFLSLEANYVVIWGAIILIVLVIDRRNAPRNIRFLAWMLLSLMSTSILVENILKPTFGRYRPHVAQRLPAITCTRGFSFPSGHSAGAFAGAAMLAQYDQKRKKHYYGLAALIALSRIYLLCHYLLDVTVGAVVGYVVSNLILRIKAYSNNLLTTKKT